MTFVGVGAHEFHNAHQVGRGYRFFCLNAVTNGFQDGQHVLDRVVLGFEKISGLQNTPRSKELFRPAQRALVLLTAQWFSKNVGNLFPEDTGACTGTASKGLIATFSIIVYYEGPRKPFIGMSTWLGNPLLFYG